MRDTTKIMAIATEALADIDATEGKPSAEVIEGVRGNLREIISTAKRMDARTGKPDPTAAKAGKS